MPQRQSRSGRTMGGKPFDKQQVIRILKNRVYVGQVKWGDEICEDAHEPIISKPQFERVQRKLRQTIARRRTHKYSRGRCYPLRGLVRCACGAMMTPHGTVGRGKTYHYYKCTKQDHQGGRIACDAPAMPAEALEEAVMDRVITLGAVQKDRERVAREALVEVDDSVRKLDAETEMVRHRLTAVQTEIQNLLGVLKQLGGPGLASVQEELAQLEEERSQLRDRLKRHAQQRAPAADKTVAARTFIESWGGVGDLLRQATPDEQRTILQHFVEVVEIGFDDDESKRGKYALRLFPEARSLDPSEGARNGEGTAVEGGDGDPVLTDEALFCEFDEKAPRLGLEPRT